MIKLFAIVLTSLHGSALLFSTAKLAVTLGLVSLDVVFAGVSGIVLVFGIWWWAWDKTDNLGARTCLAAAILGAVLGLR
jgi:hypothetical protein